MSGFPTIRCRRLRRSCEIRRLVRETSFSADDLIYPLFVVPGSGYREEIQSMPGVFHYSVDKAVEEAKRVYELGVPGILLFGIPENKDSYGSGAWKCEGTVQRAIRAIKAAVPHLLIITDVCLCQYTDTGHCGVLTENTCTLQGYTIDNDRSIELIAKTALSHAQAGADLVAPSDMMDGRVKAIRECFDENGFSDIGIMAYSAKYASAFYGPFRDAADSAPQFGDRKSYQMDTANSREALREVALDIGEGADIVMVKPALSYLDVVKSVRTTFDVPIAAYSVSGEYAMIKAASEKGWIDEKSATMELLTSIKRAGADIIITYSAPDAAAWLEGRYSVC